MQKKSALLINCLKNKKSKLIFLSPHLDDAIFSCEGLIRTLHKSNDTRIVTVFTLGDKPPYTLSTRKYLRTMGYKDLAKLYEIRREEDRKICKKMNIKYLHLGFQDSLVRKYKSSKIRNTLGKVMPEFNHLYPIFKKIFGKGVVNPTPNSHDDEIINSLKNLIKKLNKKNTIFFAPLAIGDHVDHHVVRLAVDKSNLKIVYYCDIPYLYSNPLPKKMISNMKLRKQVIEIDKADKIKMSALYTSQYKHVFNKKNLEDKEIYYINKNAYEYLKSCL